MMHQAGETRMADPEDMSVVASGCSASSDSKSLRSGKSSVTLHEEVRQTDMNIKDSSSMFQWGILAIVLVVISVILLVVATFLLLKGEEDFETAVSKNNAPCDSFLTSSLEQMVHLTLTRIPCSPLSVCTVHTICLFSY